MRETAGRAWSAPVVVTVKISPIIGDGKASKAWRSGQRTWGTRAVGPRPSGRRLRETASVLVASLSGRCWTSGAWGRKVGRVMRRKFAREVVSNGLRKRQALVIVGVAKSEVRSAR